MRLKLRVSNLADAAETLGIGVVISSVTVPTDKRNRRIQEVVTHQPQASQTTMNLPSAQFSRLVTTLAFDITDPSLDSMIRSWDHVAARFLKRLEATGGMAGRLESLRLLAIHDAVHAVFGTDGGFSYRGRHEGLALNHALSATVRASHDVLSAVFRDLADLNALADTLRETMGLIPAGFHSGAEIGSKSAAHYLKEFSTEVAQIRESLRRNSPQAPGLDDSGALDWQIYRQFYFPSPGDRRIA